MNKRRQNSEAGFSLLGLLIDVVVFATVGALVVTAIRGANQKQSAQQDKVFAAAKVYQITEEIRSTNLTQTSAGLSALDRFNEGILNPILTTLDGVSNPADALSGNAKGRYRRRVTVQRVDGNPSARRVTVGMYLTAGAHPLAEATTVLLAPERNMPPTQVYDMYVLNLETIAFGFENWAPMGPVRDMIANIVQDIQARKPGIEIRLHQITRMAYGRDPYYAPALNSALRMTEAGALPWVYLYPGRMQNGDYVYAPHHIKGKIKVDGANLPGSERYSMADQFNHAVRYPEEEALYQAAVTAAANIGIPAPEISWRMLIEGLNRQPERYRNAIVINMHGEVVPLPPMRNYSDAAKDPAGRPYLRVVTHPEKLEYAANEDVYFRVYAYRSNGDASAGTVPEIQLSLPNLPNLPAGSFTVTKLQGDSGSGYDWVPAVAAVDYTVDTTGSGTRLTLRDTELDIKLSGNGTGLPPGALLYGWYYIPSELTGATTGFHVDAGTLSQAHATRPKNTARWRVRIQGNRFSRGRYDAETWLGAASERAQPPPNLSRTYIWVAPESAPETERYQFLGDPRHMPYVDVRAACRYNWYFANPSALSSTTYPGYPIAFNGWDSGLGGAWGRYQTDDVPRFLQIIRSGRYNSEVLYATTSGNPAWMTSYGGEIHGDSVGNMRMLSRPWDPGASASATVQVCETFQHGTHQARRLIARASPAWMSRPWLGELYPDDAFTADWEPNGNLPTGTFHRARFADLGYFSRTPTNALGWVGSTGMFNALGPGGGATSSTDANGYSATLLAGGARIATALNLTLPASLPAYRPLRTDGGPTPPEWGINPYNTTADRGAATIVKRYYSGGSSDLLSAGLMRFTRGTQSTHLMHVGFYNSDIETFSATSALLTTAFALNGFLDAGSASTGGRIPQLPRMTIVTPAGGSTAIQAGSDISVSWAQEWRRWDGQPYTADYAPDHAETTPIVYHVKYSQDGGRSWRFADTHDATTPGEYRPSRAVASPLTWSTASLSAGSCILRVEAFRSDSRQHYAYHQRGLSFE